MIEFEIISGPDRDVLGSYKLNKNEFYIGQNLTDIIIRDPGLMPSHAFIEVVNNGLLFHPQKDVPFFLLNGKRSLTIRKLKNSDIIQIGETKIKIINFENTPTTTKKNILDRKLNEMINSQDPRLEIIETIGKRLK